MKNHVIEKLSAYLNHELPQDTRQAVAAHLLNCPQCREAHDEIKFGAALATNLKRADAPENTWNEIKNSLGENQPSPVAAPPLRLSFFNSLGSSVTLAPLFIVFALAAMVYLSFFGSDNRESAQNDLALVVQEKTNTGLPIVTENQGAVTVNSNIVIPANNSGVINSAAKPAQNNSTEFAPKQQEAANIPFWRVETLAGAPTAGSQTISKNGTLAVGDFLETDASSRARVQVANIGQVEVEPNSRVRLVRTQSTEHRLSLERGVLQARILAPPRLFIVDTPSAVAVDLGCAYRLEVDKAGNTRLHVTSGFVALERDGRESIVPAGAICLTRRGKGIGTPFFDDATPAFEAALAKFDFAGGGSASLQTIIREARAYDTLTLWHLLSRVSPDERGKIFDALESFVKTPAGVTRGGVLRLNKQMLESWRAEIENLWYE